MPVRVLSTKTHISYTDMTALPLQGLQLIVGIVLLTVGLHECWGFLVPEADSCYNTSAAPYKLYSTHTDYNNVRGHGTDFKMSGCVPKKLYLLSRHGIRYPTTSSYDHENRKLPRLHSLVVTAMSNGTLCQPDQDALRTWKFRFPSNLVGALADSGRTESTELGKRYLQRFPQLIGQANSAYHYDFRHTHVRRTRDTAKAIAEGFYNTSDIHMTKGSICDPLLMYYECCDKFIKSVHDHREVEHEAFRNSPEIRAVLSAITSRLGLHTGSISFGQVEDMYAACTFEQTVFGDSPWCAVFSIGDLKKMEYYKDLRYYWQYGYGHSINYEQTCDLFKDIISYLRGSSNVTVMVRVAHDFTLLSMYARLGAFRDSAAPTARNFEQQTNLKFRSSYLAPYNGNIAFVKYQCGSQTKLRAFHNENPLVLPMCPETGCPLSDFLHSYIGEFAESCDFQKTCDKHADCNGHVTDIGTCVPTIIG